MSLANRYAPSSEGMLAPFEPFLKDGTVSEILINKPGQVYVERQGAMYCHEMPLLDERYLHNLFQLIASENQQILNEANPLLSGSLQDSSRVQLVLPPVSLAPSLSIRRKTLRQLTLDNYHDAFYQEAMVATMNVNTLKNHEKDDYLHSLYVKHDWKSFIKEAIYRKKTIVISGGTSSGKTTFLNACLEMIPSSERLLILEDTREIETSHDNQLSLLAVAGEQGLAPIRMQTLVQASLRLRPDRIIIGEIRGKEILDFLGAASTGHEGSITSLHATSPSLAMMRMAQMYKLNQVSMSDADIYRELTQVIDIIVQLGKEEGGRRIQSIYYKGAQDENI